MIENLLSLANTQYNDYCGTVAADFRDEPFTIDEFLSMNGFDNSIYFPYSIKLVFGETGFDTQRSTWISILTVKVDEVGNSFQQIKDYLAQSENKKLPTYKFHFNVKIDDFFNLFKRFEIDLGLYTKSLFDYRTTVDDVIDEISLNE